MGSISAMGSLNRVIEAHGDELVAEVLASLPTAVRVLQPSISLENNTYALTVTASFAGPGGTTEYLVLDPYDIDDLAERFPDCEVGY
jgi:hypothetical protein